MKLSKNPAALAATALTVLSLNGCSSCDNKMEEFGATELDAATKFNRDAKLIQSDIKQAKDRILQEGQITSAKGCHKLVTPVLDHKETVEYEYCTKDDGTERVTVNVTDNKRNKILGLSVGKEIQDGGAWYEAAEPQPVVYSLSALEKADDEKDEKPITCTPTENFEETNVMNCNGDKTDSIKLSKDQKEQLQNFDKPLREILAEKGLIKDKDSETDAEDAKDAAEEADAEQAAAKEGDQKKK